MQNFPFEIVYGQNIFAQPYYQWNYPLFYMPYNQFPRNSQLQNSNHYQQFKQQNTLSFQPNEELRTEKVDDEDFSAQKQSESIEQSNFQKIKKKRKYYGTKNTEANIINQTFSFINCSNKSRKIFEKIIPGNDKKVDTFYVMIKIVKRNLKKYVNRTYLRSIFYMEKSNVIYKLLCKGVKRLQILPIQEFKSIFRKLVLYYFNNEMEMVTHILSSNRLSKNTVTEHLKRRREIMEFLFEEIKIDQ